MQHHHDRTTSEALTSFSAALAAAQTQLQQEEQRLAKSRAALHDLQSSTNALKQQFLQNPQRQQAVSALQRERRKLQLAVAEQRTECERLATHVAGVRSDRAAQEEELEQRRELLLLQKREYVSRAAAVHVMVAQQLIPQNQLPAQRALLATRRSELRRLAASLAEVEERKREAVNHLDRLLGKPATAPANTTTIMNNNENNGVSAAEEEEEAAAVAAAAPFLVAVGGGGGGAAATGPTATTASTGQNDSSSLAPPPPQDPSSLSASSPHSAADASDSTTRIASPLPPAAAETLASLEAQLRHVKTERERAAGEREAALVACRQQREALKTTLRALCQSVEAADAAQQRQQQEWAAALNTVPQGSRCTQCAGDILEGLY